MHLKDADKIVQEWGKHLEYVYSKLAVVFMAHIPESFLPYPKIIIEEAINIVISHYQNIGNAQAVRGLKTVAAYLHCYKDDEEALVEASSSFGNKELRKVILSELKEF